MTKPVKWVIVGLMVLMLGTFITIPAYAETDIECLSKNIYFEARGESIRGQYAVGFVVLNRMASDRFPNTACGVVYQARRWNGMIIHHRCQFSWYCDGKPDRPKNIKAWTKAVEIATILIVYQNVLIDITDGALWYHSKRVRPHWSSVYQRVALIDNHHFYNAGEG